MKRHARPLIAIGISAAFAPAFAAPLLGTAQGLSVYVDGVRVDEPFGETVNRDLIPNSAIAGIHLIPGSNPAFGLNTLGGGWQMFAKINNVFDKHYATAGALAENPFVSGGFQANPDNWRRETFVAPGAPRAAWLGVRYVFGGK
ncbi:MAG: TonB-dependent receptor [Azonexus sp.]|nr:TonB-dependent receptor [Azonexus sp.]